MTIRFADPAAADWDFPRSIAGIGLLLTAAEAHGVRREVMLRGTDLAVEDLALADREVTAAQELQVVRNLAQALGGVPGAGLGIGTAYHVSTFGIFGYALLASPTVLDAMNLALRFIDLSFTFTMPSVIVEDDRVRIVLADRGLPDDLRGFLIERDMAAIRTVLDELLPDGVRLLDAEVAMPAPADPGLWRTALGLLPRFAASRHSMAIGADQLRRRLPQGNPTTVALCESLCADLVSRRRARGGLAQQVRVLLTQQIAFGVRMDDVAAALQMSPRTLRRRLGQEGTGFQQLLDEVRHSLALEMLQTPMLGVEDIALRLGYAESSSFIHAFKRWTGRLPGQYAARRPGPPG